MIKKLLIVGYGRHGKDEAAQYLSTVTQLKYAGSCSWAALPLMADYLGIHPQAAWEQRSQNREAWKSHLDELRRYNPTRILELALRSGDIVAGIRDKVELVGAREKGLIDYVLWIHRPGFPEDPTVTFDEFDCDESIDNNGDLYKFHEDLERWAQKHRLRWYY